MIDLDLISRDLVPFTDPATKLDIAEGSAGVLVTLVRNGFERRYFLDRADASIVARYGRGQRFLNLGSLLASAEFADIRSFANTQQRLFVSFDPDNLMPAEGEIDGQGLTRQALRDKLVPFGKGETEKISLVLIDGPAGVGKTSLILSLLVQRARSQLDTHALPAILHVASRGRRLAGLDDALAQSLQLVRANFTFDQVPILVRHGLLQVAIDGFDELVDPEGYQDAWFALRDFFEQLGSGGPVILAGRDSFFDQQGFAKQLEASSRGFSLAHIRLRPASPSTARKWLERQGWSKVDLASPETGLILRSGSYALRPYFLSELAKAKSWAKVESNDLTPREFLVDKFLAREANLIGEKVAMRGSDTKAALTYLFEEIALEMADSESESVDLGFLQIVTEMAFGQWLGENDLAKLKHKAGSFALLEVDSREGHRKFPHTEISHHFLASGLVRILASGGQVRALRRTLLSADFLTIFAETLLKTADGTIGGVVRSLERLSYDETSFDRLSENVAALLLTSLCRETGTQRQYLNLVVVDAVVFGVADGARLEQVKVQRLDAREAELSRVVFADCEVVNLIADETTRFGDTRPSVHRLLLAQSNGEIREVFEPVEIQAWLGAHSRIVLENENENAIRLFEKVCRTMLRQHMIKDHADDPSGKLFRDPYWPKIEEILTGAKVLDRITKSTSGAHAEFVRLQKPYELLAARETTGKLRSVWTKIGAIPVQYR